MKTKNGIIAAIGAVVLAIVVILCIIFIKLNTTNDPTQPNETTPTNPIEIVKELDVISVGVYGDIFITQKEGFKFENPKTNDYQLSFRVVWNSETLFESDFINPGESVKWDTKDVEMGFYDCQVEVRSKNVETGKEGNRFSLQQMFYIDETTPIETSQLFLVSIPEHLIATVKDGEVTISGNEITIIKCTNEDGAPLPRTEIMSLSALGIEKGEMMITFDFENITEEGEEICHTIKMNAAFNNGKLEDGEYEETTCFYFNGYAETGIIQ